MRQPLQDGRGRRDWNAGNVDDLVGVGKFFGAQRVARCGAVDGSFAVLANGVAAELILRFERALG